MNSVERLLQRRISRRELLDTATFGTAHIGFAIATGTSLGALAKGIEANFAKNRASSEGANSRLYNYQLVSPSSGNYFAGRVGPVAVRTPTPEEYKKQSKAIKDRERYLKKAESLREDHDRLLVDAVKIWLVSAFIGVLRLNSSDN